MSTVFAHSSNGTFIPIFHYGCTCYIKNFKRTFGWKTSCQMTAWKTDVKGMILLKFILGKWIMDV